MWIQASDRIETASLMVECLTQDVATCHCSVDSLAPGFNLPDSVRLRICFRIS